MKWTKSKSDSKRGLEATESKSAEDRAEDLEQMLGCIANFCTVIARNSIIYDSKSLDDIWQKIRLYYGFHTSGANFLDFSNIKLEAGERNETLYQRMSAFINDNLLKADGNLTHDDEEITSDEIVSPTLENLIVLLWLEKLHPRLPALVKQKYATALRSKTLYSLKPEISMAIPSLLEEAQSVDEARIMRMGGSGSRNKSGYNKFDQARKPFTKKSTATCALCEQAGRPSNHFLSKCHYLPSKDKKFLAKSRRVMSAFEEENSSGEEEESYYEDKDEHQYQEELPRIPRTRRVMVKPSPWFNVHHNSSPITITLDCGAEADLIRLDVAIRIGAKIMKANQLTTQVDGKSTLRVVGEVHLVFTRGNNTFDFSGLVVEDMDVEVLGSVPFLSRNRILPNCADNEIILRDGSVIKYESNLKAKDSSIRRATLVRAPVSQTLWPGDYIEVDLNSTCPGDKECAIEPRGMLSGHDWVEPAIIRSVGGAIRIQNDTTEPRTIKKHEHIAQLVPTYYPEIKECDTSNAEAQIRNISSDNFTQQISVDPDNVFSPELKEKFHALHRKYNRVFDSSYEGYNHSYGKFEAVVNMGNVKPPQRKGKLPQYSRDKLSTVQEHFDKLEKLGVLAKPESIGVNVEYVNPSFLVKKSNDTFRLVTAFTEVGKYCKPQPTLLPTVDSTLRTIANWKFLIKTDLKSAYYQIPLSKESMKYCGTVSPYKGTRVYTRCAMGMPGSESALEELLSRVLGDLIAKGVIAKLADDLYVGGDTGLELLQNWEEVLYSLDAAGLRLTEPKTVIGPKETDVLGWLWREGQLIASPHKVAALSMCVRPKSVKEMRSFLGAYKVLARVIPKCSHFLQPLTRATAGKTSIQKIEWNDTLVSAFESAQKHLQSNKAIQLPREEDQLFVVTDGASAQPAGIGATLYVVRDGKAMIGGFFSQQLKPEQSLKWFPCEIEGLGIAGAVKFFSPYIIQSKHTTKILTDNKPCVDAYNKLCKGEFSSNARLSTFLTTVSRHHVTISHLPGEVNLPSDFSSRNPVPCVSDRCQVCLFATQIDESVVRNVSVSDIKSGSVHMPFTNRKAWLATQGECSELRRVKAQLQQGTRPSKKDTKSTNVKRYLNKVTIASDGLLVVRKSDPLCPSREAIVVPVQVISGLMTALHIKLGHPTSNELFTIADRYFFALNLSRVIDDVSKGCHTCVSLATIPKSLVVQTSSDPPEVVGIQFACDVVRRERQMILVVREYVSSFTATCLISSEQHGELRNALIRLLVGMVPLDGPCAIVRVDPAPGFKALKGDPILRKHRIELDVGREKNINKNPVAERAVQELEEVIQRQDFHNAIITESNLAIITARLNNKLRSNGLSSREIFTQRDQFSHQQIPLEDKQIIFEKHASALKNHQYSESFKSRNNPTRQNADVAIGDLVHLCSDKSKHHPRERYLVTSIDGNWCQVRKFVGSQLRTNPYKVPLNEIFRVPSPKQVRFQPSESEEEECEHLQVDNDSSVLTSPTEVPCVENIPPSETPQVEESAVSPIEMSPDIPAEITRPLESNDVMVMPQVSAVGQDSSLPNLSSDEPVQGLRRSTREKRLPPALKDYKM